MLDHQQQRYHPIYININKMKTIGIIFVVLIIIVSVWYFLIYKKAPPVDSGTVNSGGQTKTCADGSVIAVTQDCPPPPLFKVGDDVYAKALRSTYMYIYSFPNNNVTNEVGRATNSLLGSGSIGKYIQMGGNGKFVKIRFSGSPVEIKTINPNRPNSYYYNVGNLSGEYYVPTEQVQNTPY